MYLESVSCFLLLKVQMHKFPFNDLSQKDVAFCLQPPADLVEGLFFNLGEKSLYTQYNGVCFRINYIL